VYTQVKNRFEDDAKALGQVTTEAQVTEITTMCSETEEWLYDDGRSADRDAFVAKKKAIEVKAEAAFDRLAELTRRPAAVTKVR